ncbi:MAG TPA: hypothetical protein VJ672_09480 [Gemmatimonadaceae bacterium]|nr:hypothetical protein [Gemmatimonadaceae bacterium]
MTPTPRLIAVLAASSALAALGACNLSTDLDPDDIDVGIAVVEMADNGGGNFVAHPEVQFARNAFFSVENSAARGDACGGPQAIPTGGGGAGTIEFLDAGPTLSWQQGANNTQLVKLVNGTVITYTAPSPAGIAATPGALVTLTVPGADPGFPAMAVTARLAEPLTGIGPINPNPAAGQGLALSWTPTTTANDSAKVEFRIQYSTSGTTPTDEVICRLDDDGAFTVDNGQLFGWRNAQAGSRRVIASRYRSTIVVQGDVQLAFISSFPVTKTTFP